MMKYIHEHSNFQEYLSSLTPPFVVARHFFHELGEGQEKTMTGLLSNILQQIVHQFDNSISLVFPDFQRLSNQPLGNRRSIWTESQLKRTLVKVLSQRTSITGIMLFIDGLDECEGDHREQLEYILSMLHRATNGKLSLRLCLASRPLPAMEVRLSTFPQCKVHEYTVPDISCYVRDRLGFIQNGTPIRGNYIEEETLERLLNEIIDKAKGVFLWVKLVVKNLNIGLEEGDDFDELAKRLHALPSDLETMYSLILDQISDEYVHDTIHYSNLLQHHNIFSENMGLLQFTLATRDTRDCLSPEIRHTLAAHRQLEKDCERVEARIKGRCRGLIQVTQRSQRSRAHDEQAFVLQDPIRKRVEFLHLTVQKYLKREDVLHSLISRTYENKLRDVQYALLASNLGLLKLIQPEHLFQELNRMRRFSSPVQAYIALALTKDNPSDNDLSNDDFSESDHQFVAYRKLRESFFTSEDIEKSTGISPTLFVKELDQTCSNGEKMWQYIFVRYHHYRRNNEIYEPDQADNTDLVSLALGQGLYLYVKDAIEIRGYDPAKKSGRPLIHYFVDSIYYGSHLSAILSLLPTLLENVSPNLRYSPHPGNEGTSAWRHFLELMCNERTWLQPTIKSDELIQIVEVMLDYGADPNEQILVKGHDIPIIIVTIRRMRDAPAWRSGGRTQELFISLLKHGADLEPEWVGGTTVREEVEKQDPATRIFCLEKLAEYSEGPSVHVESQARWSSSKKKEPGRRSSRLKRSLEHETKTQPTGRHKR